jgi:OFA family oxalate/formate antiporter-like MFS transporter
VANENQASAGGIRSNPWVQLIAGIICMAMVANLQYGWTLFVDPINAKYHWDKVAIQYTFTLFVLLETWLVPIEAYLADKYGPRILVFSGSILIAISWMFMSRANTLPLLYTAGAIGGIGTGLVYGTCVGNAVKWFRNNRGLAAGLTAAGFGAGAAITVLPLTHSLATRGYEQTLFNFALLQGGVVLLMSLILAKPASGALVRRSNAPPAEDAPPLEMIGRPVFWFMYVAFTMAGASGLMATAQMAPIANSFGIAKLHVEILGFAGPALAFALSLNNLMNGLGRPLFGYLSDFLGREFTLCGTFLAGGAAMLGLGHYGHDPVLFVVFAALVYIFWGDIYSIFPAMTSDEFGSKYATTNYGILYTGKGFASFFAPIAGAIAAKSGNWTLVLEIAAVMNLIAALIMVFAVRPLRQRSSAAAAVAVSVSDAVTP